MDLSHVEPITNFRGKYSFLSNFFYSPMEFEGLLFPTAEHAYQAQKARDPAMRKQFADATMKPGVAKRLGRMVKMRDEWDHVKVGVMREIIRAKFSNKLHLRAALMDTHPAVLIEENSWGDTFWGEYKGKGANMLGRILMEVRNEILSEQP